MDLVGDLAGILSIATKEGRLTVERELSNVQPVDGLEASGEGQQDTDFAENWEIPVMVAGIRVPRSEMTAEGPQNPSAIRLVVAGTRNQRCLLPLRCRVPRIRVF